MSYSIRRILGSLSILALAPLAAQAASLAGLWDFDNAENLGEAAVGNDLTVSNTHGTIVARAGIDANDGAAEVGIGDYFAAAPDIIANGQSESYVNEYTLVYDIYLPQSTDSSWRSLLQTAAHPGDNDGDYFVSSTNKVGVSAINYSDKSVSAGQWVRLIFSASIGNEPSFTTTFISESGESWQHDHASQSLNGRHALYPASGNNVVYFFADENGEDKLVYVTQLAIYDGAIDRVSALAMGGPGAALSDVNAAPTIAEGNSGLISVDMNSSAQTYSLHGMDVDSSELSWSVDTQPENGTVGIVSDSNGVVEFNYTPDTNFVGLDTFVMAVSDGNKSTRYTYSVTVVDPNQSAYQQPVGLWEFNYPSDITLATIGDDLTLEGSGISTGEGTATLGVGTSLRMVHGIDVNASNGAWVNEYTLLFDVRYASSNNWKTLFQCSPDNTDDGDLFIRPDTGTIGTAVGLDGYSSNGTTINTWYRIVMTVENGVSRKVYVNGTLWNPGVAGEVDDRYGLRDSLLIFADESGEDGEIEVNNLAIWDYALDDVAVAVLGDADADIYDAPEPSPNYVPVITEGDTLALDLTMNSSAQTIVLHATDADNDVLLWSVSGAPESGLIEMLGDSGDEAMLTYTPGENFVGTDTFVIRAEDEKSYDEITVTVTVTNAAPVLSEGDAYTFNATMNMGEQSFVLTATDANNNALTWAVSTEPAHGAVSLSEEVEGKVTVSFAPETNFSGLDSFVVTVSDGLATDSITVTVNVADPNADPTLTIVDAAGMSSPAAGSYQYPVGSAVELSTRAITTENERQTPVGWTLTGGNSVSGEGATATIELSRNSVFTWHYKTEYKLDLEASEGGTLSREDGWYEGGRPLQLTATAEEGYYFAGFEGDIEEAVVGGQTMVLPMDRVYGTITARFEPEQPFAVIAIPDTQNYTSLSSPTDIFEQQTRWVVDNIQTFNIQFVTHLGDVVNSPSSTSQWNRAMTAMALLDGQLPYGIVPGNHDVNSSRSNSEYLKRFGPDAERWYDPADGERYDWYRGASPTGYSSYQIITVNGREWMFLHMDIDATDQDIAWAQDVLDAHPTTLTMLTTHNYLAESGGSGSSGSGTGERGRVSVMWFGGSGRNTPEQLFQKLIKPNNQIYMVICGHNFAIYNLEETNDAGNVVHELLVDYQTLPNGGNGFLRIMEFDPSAGMIYNSTYSPYLGRYYDPESSSDAQGMAELHDKFGGEFEINVDFDSRFNHTLTVASENTNVTPAVGEHSLADGTPLVIEASDVVAGTTRQHVSGWTLAGDEQNLSGEGTVATITMKGDATLSWHYSTQYYLQTQSVGDGIVSVSSGWQDEGAVIEIQAQPDAGASFTGWSGDIDGASINGTTLTLTVDRARGPVTAEFTSSTPVQYVQVLSEHSTVSPAPATYTYEAGSTVTFSASAFVDGDTRYVPIGYSYTLGSDDAVDGTETSVDLSLSADLVFTWKWGTQYRLDVTTNGPGTTEPQAGWVNRGQSLTLTAQPNEHAQFAGWSGATDGLVINGAQLIIDAMSGAVGPITANFVMQQFVLTVQSPDGSSGSEPTTQSYDYGSTVTVTAEPEGHGRTRRVATDWTLSGAHEGSGSGNAVSVEVTGDTTVSWNWQTQVLLELASGAQGVITPLNAARWYPLDTEVTLEAKPGAWFEFVSWKGDLPALADAGEPALSVTMDEPKTLVADFRPHLAPQGTPYWWLEQREVVTGGNYAEAEQSDLDGDGLTEAQTFLTGAPKGQSFALGSTYQASYEVPVVALSWMGRPGRTYALQRSSALGEDFATVEAEIAGQGSAIKREVVLGNGETAGFWRVSVDLDAEAAEAAVSPGAAAMLFEREMCLVPAGVTVMGKDGAGMELVEPEHRVTVQAFYMDKFEVTRADWATVARWAAEHGYDLSPELRYIDDTMPDEDHPAVPISWYDAVKWCNARSEMEGLMPAYYTDAHATTVYRSGKFDLSTSNVNWSGNGYRLPTEAEWEYAARGGLADADYPWGDESAIGRANSWQYLESIEIHNNPYPITLPVGYFDGHQAVAEGQVAEDMANGYGLYDMAANAYEWVWDRSSAYTALEEFDPRGTDSGAMRVLRGGSWWNNSVDARVFHRYPFPPDGDDPYGVNGFRCVRSVLPAVAESL